LPDLRDIITQSAGPAKKNSKAAFTLIELLVVISVIALLLAILMPSLAKSKELTRRVVCASHLHQFVLAMTCYANDYDNHLPRFDMRDFPPYVHNVDKQFTSCMKDNYGLGEKMFYCPSLPGRWVRHAKSFYADSKGDVIGYGLWVPRLCLKYADLRQCPPEHDGSYPWLVDTEKPFRGPRKVTESLGASNPILTDQSGTKMTNPPTGDLSKDSHLIHKAFPHQWNGVIEISNNAFVDGHVAKVPGSKLKVRFGTGNNGWWQWR